jgi:putative hydrolase of the HAD superfamily
MIFFDIDRTLINHQHAQDTAAVLFLQYFSALLPYSPEEFCRYWQAVMKKHFTAFARGEITFVEHRRRRVREIFQETESSLADDAADRRFAIYLQYYEQNWTLFDDVLPCLNALSHFRLGIISNGNTEQQQKKLSQTGILERFDVVIVSEEIGVAKPKPDIFLSACLRSGVKARQCSYVGDSLQDDALAAEAVGMRGIWLNRSNLSAPQIALPTIENLNQLVTVIG